MCSLGLNSSFWFRVPIPAPRGHIPVLVPYFRSYECEFLSLKGQSWVWVPATCCLSIYLYISVYYLMSNSQLSTHHLSTLCWTCQPNFFWQPVARTVPLFLLHLTVAVFHNPSHSGLTHLIIIQDLVLTGEMENITKKGEKVPERKAKERGMVT